jgi:hypothetical protein
MKHFLRRHVAGHGLVDKNQPSSATCRHHARRQRPEVRVALRWSANGSAENDWVIPADAKQG